MKILAFDGTAKIASVAVLDGERVLGRSTVDNGLTQSELLLPMAEDLLRSLKMDFSDVELFAVAVGPGSFTGVRIGVSLVKGLAFGRDVPCVEVSTLEALAYNLRGLSGLAVPCMDARRGQFYTATFLLIGESAGVVRIDEDSAMSLKELVENVDSLNPEKIYVCGDGREKVFAELNFLKYPVETTPPLLADADAASVGALAYKKYMKGESVTDTELSPVYLRLPQAERERLEREKNN